MNFFHIIFCLFVATSQKQVIMNKEWSTLYVRDCPLNVQFPTQAMSARRSIANVHAAGRRSGCLSNWRKPKRDKNDVSDGVLSLVSKEAIVPGSIADVALNQNRALHSDCWKLGLYDGISCKPRTVEKRRQNTVCTMTAPTKDCTNYPSHSRSTNSFRSLHPRPRKRERTLGAPHCAPKRPEEIHPHHTL